MAASAYVRVCCEHGSVDVAFARELSEVVVKRAEEAPVRSVGMDVHRDFCEVAIAEDGVVRSVGRVATEPEALKLLAGSLCDTDEVAIEATANAVAIARIIEPHVRRVVLANPRAVREKARRAKSKTDRIDARLLARLLASGTSTRSGRPMTRPRPDGA